MKRFRLLLAAATLAVAATPGIAVATHSSGDDPNHDQVDGTGRLGAPFFTQVHVNATSGPSGEDAQGQYYIDKDVFGRDFRGRVTCLTVIGNLAVVGAVIERSDFSTLFPVGYFVRIVVHDLGEPGDVDGINFSEANPLPVSCVFPFATLPMQQGNFIVHDALP
jgi:hypothetical protein